MSRFGRTIAVEVGMRFRSGFDVDMRFLLDLSGFFSC